MLHTTSEGAFFTEREEDTGEYDFHFAYTTPDMLLQHTLEHWCKLSFKHDLIDYLQEFGKLPV